MSTGGLCESTRGVFIIAPTPFDDMGVVDAASIDGMVDFFIDKGVDGITILGVLGEAPKLSGDERRAVMNQVLRHVAGRVKVVVGASDAGTDNPVAFARDAMAPGAGLMFAPVPGLRTDDQVFGYGADVLERLGPGVPICYQDDPQTTIVVSAVRVVKLGFGLALRKEILRQPTGRRHGGDRKGRARRGRRRPTTLFSDPAGLTDVRCLRALTRGPPAPAPW